MVSILSGAIEEKHLLESTSRTGAVDKLTSLVKIKGFGLREERLSLI